MSRRNEYTKLETTGVKKLSSEPANFGDFPSAGSGLFTSPYSVFIPMQYLSLANVGYSHYTTDAAPSRVIRYGRQRTLPERINDYLYSDSLEEFPLNVRGINSELIREYFVKFEYVGGVIPGYMKIRWIGGYSLFTNSRRGPVPNILAVTLPENIIYHKLRVLAGKPVDMSKVIILIDNQLFRYRAPYIVHLYDTVLKPAILETAASVWEVPSDFIINSCFSGSYEQTGSIKQRKSMETKLISEFLVQ